MSSSSQKHRAFVSEPLGNKPVRDVPGIGQKAAGKLQNQGYDKAYQVVGQYNAQGRSDTQFKGWLQNNAHSNDGNAAKANQAVKEWGNNHM